MDVTEKITETEQALTQAVAQVQTWGERVLRLQGRLEALREVAPVPVAETPPVEETASA